MTPSEPQENVKNDLAHEFQALKAMLNMPRLYLRKYFFDIRNKIDLVYTKKFLEANDAITKETIFQTRASLFRDLFIFEESCMRNAYIEQLPMSTRDNIDILEQQLDALKENDTNKTREFEKKIKEVSNNLKKILLLNRNFIYSTGSSHNMLIELDISEGVFVKNHRNELSLSKNFLIKNELKCNAKMLKLCFSKLKITQVAENFLWQIESKEIINEMNISNKKYFMTIDSNEFKGLTHLKSLKRLLLTNNNLYTISSNAFNDLNSLEELFLYSNKLTSIDETIFSINLKGLTQLDLSSNQISYLSPNSFTNLTNLKSLNISNNKLIMISNGTFSKLKALKILDLSLNQLESIQYDLFSSLNQLVKLNLSNNLFRNINDESFSKLPCLEELVLDNNQLIEISQNVFKDLKNLKFLSLHHNLIQSINFNAFKNLNQLKYLDLYDNQISELKYSTFDGLNNLEDLKLSSNKLSEIDLFLFINLKRLKYLSLCSNELTNINNFELSRNFVDLIEFNISNNNLSIERILSQADELSYRLLI